MLHGFITKNGDFYQCQYGEHAEMQKVLKEEGMLKITSMDNAPYFVIPLGVSDDQLRTLNRICSEQLWIYPEDYANSMHR